MPLPNMPQPHDNWAQYYDFVYQKTYGRFYESMTESTLSYLSQILPKGTILDYGAGTGRLSFPLQEMGYDVIAVEKSTEMAIVINEKALQNGIQFPVHSCSISDYRGPSGDMALCVFTVLSYSITEEELFNNLSNVYKHLNPNGYFFFDLPNAVFFQQQNLANIISTNFNRYISLTPTEINQIYLYEENCSGTIANINFAYEDTFEIRNWNLNYVGQLLQEIGFQEVNTEFNRLMSSGSTYKLYQKL